MVLYRGKIVLPIGLVVHAIYEIQMLNTVVFFNFVWKTKLNRPLWLLVGTHLAFGPELAYRLRVAQPTLMDVTRYFWYTFILLNMFVYYIFMTSPLWLAVGPQST